MAKTAPKEPTFEESLERLQFIVETLDSEGVSLQDSLTLYREGVGLLERCVRELTEAKTAVMELRKKSEGIFELLEAPDSLQ